MIPTPGPTPRGNLLGDWRGEMEITGNGSSTSCNTPHCAGLTVQNRVYGCGIDATFSVDSKGQQTLEGDFHGGVTFCPSDPSADVNTHFKFCRPSPCPVPPPAAPEGD